MTTCPPFHALGSKMPSSKIQSIPYATSKYIRDYSSWDSNNHVISSNALAAERDALLSQKGLAKKGLTITTLPWNPHKLGISKMSPHSHHTNSHTVVLLRLQLWRLKRRKKTDLFGIREELEFKLLSVGQDSLHILLLYQLQIAIVNTF